MPTQKKPSIDQPKPPEISAAELVRLLHLARKNLQDASHLLENELPRMKNRSARMLNLAQIQEQVSVLFFKLCRDWEKSAWFDGKAQSELIKELDTNFKKSFE